MTVQYRHFRNGDKGPGMSRIMQFVKRPVIYVPVLTALGIMLLLGVWLVRSEGGKTGPRRIYDEASLIPANDLVILENYLACIFEESDVDVRLVLLENLGGATPEQ